MSYRNLIRSNRLPYHVTARTNNRERFPLPLDRAWELIGSETHAAGVIFGAEVHSLVLMPNHFHLLVTTPGEDLGKVMDLFMGHLTQEINRLSGREGHVFRGRYRRSLIRSTTYYANAFKYVYRNPVKAGLVEKVEDWPFSSLYGLLGKSPLGFPIHLTQVGMEIAFPGVHPPELLNWLNRPFPKDAEGLVQKGLRRSVFDCMIDRRTRSPYEVLARVL